jgi:hypothetical protein
MNWSQLPQEYKDLPKGVDFWVKCREAKDVSELPPISKTISQEKIQKEIALFVAFFYCNEYTGMGLINTFDTIYELAKSFVVKYPPLINWEQSGIDYESTAHQFILDNFTIKNFK